MHQMRFKWSYLAAIVVSLALWAAIIMGVKQLLH
ncbi:hypothetical protein SAMN05518855_101475 [Paenibacillus sp. CF384]|nr:hypothetical protein SAMN05518855_101475 [Paenibacillus sp. CF384]